MRALISTTEAIVFLTGLDIHDRCDAGAVFYQLSYEATHLGAGQFVGLICSPGARDLFPGSPGFVPVKGQILST